ncbi:MAG TPA: adenylate/guanylate cyclase domain-containing protein [Candidatus Acidoferrales bacterium]|jgi:adenylate cyclase|nr:adenylate/guanylate cyclase domain-containing protein [Candidatus Acidoferrales bacterium]
MRKLLNDLSIRGKLVLLISGSVCVLTAAVLTVVWVQSVRQVRAIIHDQLDANRQLFAFAERSHYQSRVYKGTALASSPAAIQALERHDQAAACAFLSQVLASPRYAPNDDDLDYVSIRPPDGSILGFAVQHHAVCDPQTLEWHLPDVHEALSGAPEITTWTGPDNAVYRIFAFPVRGPDGALGFLNMGFEEDDGIAAGAKVRSGMDVVTWQEDDDGRAHILGVSDPSLRAPLTQLFDNDPDLRHPFDFRTPKGEYEGEEVLVADTGMIEHNPAGVHMAFLESVSRRMKPFRILEEFLGGLALAALLLGTGLGFLFSGVISAPLVNLADAARELEQGKYEAIESFRSAHASRIEARDEIGHLSRAFVDMGRGLKQRFAMSKYMSRTTYQMLEQGGTANPAGERKWLALVFSDVRGFTAFSEDRDPALVIERLNEVLGLEADVVRRHGGDVDKFVGDAMFAWFPGPDRCRHAVDAAVEILAGLQARFGGKAGTEIGFGIHVGEVVVGSMGSQDRRDYTAIGRSVNLAARLCSAAQSGQILVSQSVATELEDALSLKPLAPISAKGFPEPVRVFEVEHAKPSPDASPVLPPVTSLT